MIRNLTIPLRSFQAATRVFSSRSLLIRGGTILNADRQRPADVLIKDGKISTIAAHNTIQAGNAEVLNASGKLLFPGGIDCHTHLNFPFAGQHSVDDFESGTRAAIAGGTTCIVDFLQPRLDEPLQSAYERWRGCADTHVHCDYALHCCILSWNSDTKKQMEALVKEGVTTFKAFMAYKGSMMLDDVGLYHFFEACRDLGALALVHCECGDPIDLAQQHILKLGVTGPEGHYMSRPDTFEAEATHRAIVLAEYTNTPLYVVHCMSALACDEIARGRARGNILFGETLGSALALDGRGLWNPDWRTAANHVMSPPLNPDPGVKHHLMNMLQAGVLQTVGSDNCGFTDAQRKVGFGNFSKIPNGFHGIEDRVSLVWQHGVNQGRLGRTNFVSAVSTNAAKLMDLYPAKGIIEPGADADLVIWDPERERVIRASAQQHRIEYNLFEGQVIKGAVDTTISRGAIVYSQGCIMSRRGQGKFIPRTPFGYSFERHTELVNRLDPRKRQTIRK